MDYNNPPEKSVEIKQTFQNIQSLWEQQQRNKENNQMDQLHQDKKVKKPLTQEQERKIDTIFAQIKALIALKHMKNDKHPAEIIPNLYIGSIGTALSKNLIKELGIKFILSAVEQMNLQFEESICVKQIKILDKADQDLRAFFEESNQFIENALKSQEKVLVHCFAGKSRSSTLMAAYLMKALSKTRDEALEMIREKRPIIQPNQGFMNQLLDYQLYLDEQKGQAQLGEQEKNQQDKASDNSGKEELIDQQILDNEQEYFNNIQKDNKDNATIDLQDDIPNSDIQENQRQKDEWEQQQQNQNKKEDIEDKKDEIDIENEKEISKSNENEELSIITKEKEKEEKEEEIKEKDTEEENKDKQEKEQQIDEQKTIEEQGNQYNKEEQEKINEIQLEKEEEKENDQGEQEKGKQIDEKEKEELEKEKQIDEEKVLEIEGDQQNQQEQQIENEVELKEDQNIKSSQCDQKQQIDYQEKALNLDQKQDEIQNLNNEEADKSEQQSINQNDEQQNENQQVKHNSTSNKKKKKKKKKKANQNKLESLGYMFEWNGDGNNVEIVGNWINWDINQKIKMEKTEKGTFQKEVFLPTNKEIQFKFIVDDKWIIDKSLPIVHDANGNENNTLDLSQNQ